MCQLAQHCLRTLLFTVIVAVALAGCESEEKEDKTEATAESGEKEVDLAALKVEALRNTLDRTLLNAHASRDLALADVAEKVFGVARDETETPAGYLEKVCAEATDAKCEELPAEARYFAVLAATLTKLGEAADKQGNGELATALKKRAEGIQGGLSAQAVAIPDGDEPLLNLIGDPTLVVTGEGLVALMGPFPTRMVAPIPDPEAEADDGETPYPELVSYLDAVKQGDLFPALGLPPAKKNSGTPIKPGDTVLQVSVEANSSMQGLVELGKVAYKHKHKTSRFVVRSRETGTLGFFDLNFVKASSRGSDYGLEIKATGVTWYDTSGEEEKTQAVSWEDLDRLGEIARQPRDQVVLYIGVAPEITGQQFADAMGAVRKRCGDQEVCPSLQLGLALKARPAEK